MGKTYRCPKGSAKGDDHRENNKRGGMFNGRRGGQSNQAGKGSTSDIVNTERKGDMDS